MRLTDQPRVRLAVRVVAVVATIVLTVAVVLAIVVAATGVAGIGRDRVGHLAGNLTYTRYDPAPDLFTVQVPRGWSRVEQDGSVAFSDRYNQVRIAAAARPVAPDVASLVADLGAVQAEAHDFVGGDVKLVDHPAGRVWVARYRADVAVDPARGKVISADFLRYQFWRDGQLVILTLSSPRGADNARAWRAVADSFRWTQS